MSVENRSSNIGDEMRYENEVLFSQTIIAIWSLCLNIDDMSALSSYIKKVLDDETCIYIKILYSDLSFSLLDSEKKNELIFSLLISNV